MTSFTSLRHELALEQAIAAQRDALVRRANTTVLILGSQPGRLKENQLRNVVSVAATVDSIEALLNYIRYQIAREPSRDQGWRTRSADSANDFGHQVLADLQHDIRSAADATVALVGERLGSDAPAADILRSEAYRRLCEEYLGYLNRAFVYCEKTDNGRGYQHLRAAIGGQQ